MAAVKKFIWSLGSDNLPLFFMGVGALMLCWIFFLGDMVMGH